MRVLIILVLISLPLMAQENVGVGADGRLQTSRIASDDNISGGNVGLDTIYYDYILGFTASDSARAGGYSRYIMLGGTQADTSDSDTLIWCIDQLKATGGDIYICGTTADTIHWYNGGTAYDSLPTSGGIDGTIIVDGDGMDKVVHWGGDIACFRFTEDRHAGLGGARLIWRNQCFIGRNAVSGGNSPTFFNFSGRIDVESCRLINVWWYFYQSYAGAGGTPDSVRIVKDCIFGDGVSIEGGVTASTGAKLTIKDCTGYFTFPDSRMPSLTIQNCDFSAVKEISFRGSSICQINILGNSMRFRNNGTYEGIYSSNGGASFNITGNRFEGPGDGSVPWATNFSALDSDSHIAGNHVYDMGIAARGMVVGNHVYDAATAFSAVGSYLILQSNTATNSTTGFDVNGHTNVSIYNCTDINTTTGISGTPANSGNNVSY